MKESTFSRRRAIVLSCGQLALAAGAVALPMPQGADHAAGRVGCSSVTGVQATVAVAVAAPKPDLVTVTVQTVALDVTRGLLTRFSLADGLILQTEAAGTVAIPTRDIVRILTPARKPTHTEPEFMFELVGGDVLLGRVVGAVDNSVAVATRDVGRVDLPLEAFAGLATPRALEPAYRESAEWFRVGRGRKGIGILLTNGDLISGRLRQITANGLTIETPAGDRVVSYRLVVAARFTAPEPSAIAAVSKPFVIVTFHSGGRLSMADLRWAGRVAEGRLVGGQDVKFDAARIERLEVVGGSWEWLSQHQPVAFVHTPMLSLQWPWAKDRNVLGGPISVAGQVFERGIGVHSRCSLIYDLHGDYGGFTTSFGIDDNSGPYADVVVRIIVDGHVRFEQAGVRAGRLWGPLRLDVSGANRLELLVDFGENGDLQDRFNWIEAALIKKQDARTKGSRER